MAFCRYFCHCGAAAALAADVQGWDVAAHQRWDSADVHGRDRTSNLLAFGPESSVANFQALQQVITRLTAEAGGLGVELNDGAPLLGEGKLVVAALGGVTSSVGGPSLGFVTTIGAKNLGATGAHSAAKGMAADVAPMESNSRRSSSLMTSGSDSDSEPKSESSSSAVPGLCTGGSSMLPRAVRGERAPDARPAMPMTSGNSIVPRGDRNGDGAWFKFAERRRNVREGML
eukprot:CAMPEP_0179016984 /NCGR_PEP_ID=MMETSP0796-20121207/3608_1 /TAXON_ID=73915 /ORGANISM="Pyrodinium bahamense, Strain pbaha01" /LENGTH=229 /DNA_ID=CAMNT_0020712705 /DNA_START=215 /DNA_END=905 /DNA_ORIENTATION=-